jgi:hypothetical protein
MIMAIRCEYRMASLEFPFGETRHLPIVYFMER